MKSIVYNLKTVLVKLITQTEDLKGFAYLVDQNRGINKTHVATIKQSFETFGTAGATVTIVESRATGGMMRFVADGQHRLTAAIELGLPLNVCIVRLEEDTTLNLTKFISVLNNTSKAWTNETYLKSFASNGLSEYKDLQKLRKESKLTMSDLFNIFLENKAPLVKEYKNGNLEIPNKEDKMELYRAVLKCLPYIPKKSYTRRSLYTVMREAKDYNKLAKAIVTAGKAMEKAHGGFSENEAEFLRQLNHIRKATFKVK